MQFTAPLSQCNSKPVTLPLQRKFSNRCLLVLSSHCEEQEEHCCASDAGVLMIRAECESLTILGQCDGACDKQHVRDILRALWRGPRGGFVSTPSACRCEILLVARVVSIRPNLPLCKLHFTMWTACCGFVLRAVSAPSGERLKGVITIDYV